MVRYLGIEYTVDNKKLFAKEDDNANGGAAMPPKAGGGETEQQSQNPVIEQAAKQSQSNVEVQPGAC